MPLTVPVKPVMAAKISLFHLPRKAMWRAQHTLHISHPQQSYNYNTATSNFHPLAYKTIKSIDPQAKNKLKEKAKIQTQP
jgi:hypothetical protein